MSIDPNSSIPIFLQIAAHIRHAIAAGIYKPGEMVPSVRQLAIDLTVNPNTVQRAYETLEREGVVGARKGRGMFVMHGAVESARETSQTRFRRALREALSAARNADLTRAQVRALFRETFNEIYSEHEARS